MLADLMEQATSMDGIDSITVVRNGYVVMDAVIYPFPEETAHNVYSCTKSVTGTLIGIAIDQGLIAGVDVPVVELLPDAAPANVDELKAAMTVEDLLTMSSGLRCRDSSLYDRQGLFEMMESDDWAAHMLALPMLEEPGTRFEYCNGASELLSAILSEVTGMPAAEYADEVLFGPLGIADYVWPANPQGITMGSHALRLRPADMAKIGYLYLRDGWWDGEQVVSASWIEAATTAQIRAETNTSSYGYQWWVDDGGDVIALGYGGQYVIVVPDRDLVVVFTSGLPENVSFRPRMLTEDSVVPAARSDEPLPADPEAEARLAAAAAAAAAGPEPQIVELPETAAAIDGVRYEYRPNDWGLEWFAIQFLDDTAAWRGEDAEGAYDLIMGLDGRFIVNDDPPFALRGAWQTNTTFVIELHPIGEGERGTIYFSFADSSVQVVAESMSAQADAVD
jgi:CubicO group peptidase (beta-lactamase class C family)